MVRQKELVRSVKKRGLTGSFEILVGGAPVTKKWAEDIGADGYAENAMNAVSLVSNLMKKQGGEHV
jgi:methanogenic corrinoid protein MtbC1